MRKQLLLIQLLLFVSITSASVLVLMYHQFDPNPKTKCAISPEDFANHLNELREEGFRILTFDEAIRRFDSGDTSSIPEVLITMDDGWGGVYDYAYPILKEKEASAVAFIYPRAIGFNYRGFVDWDQIAEMDHSGVINAQSHALTHSMLSRYSGEGYLHYLWRLEGELYASKYILENELGKPIRGIAYPYGIVSSELFSAARRAGYDYGFSCRSPFSTGSYSRMAIPRYEITRDMTSIRSLLSRFKNAYGDTPPLVMAVSGALGANLNEPELAVKSMSNRELAGQIVFVNLGKEPSGDDLRGLFVEYGIGGAILDADFLAKTALEKIEVALELCHSLPAIPTMFIIRDDDAAKYGYLGGDLDSKGISLTAMRELGRKQGRMLKAYGIHLLLGPKLDIAPETLTEYTSADGYPAPTAGGLVGRSNSASFLIQGMQEEGVFCVVRDFPGHNPPGPDDPLAVIAHSYDVLRGRELIAFASASVAGAAGCLIGHFQYPGIDSLPVVQSPFFYSVLRDSLGFSGIAIAEDVTWRACDDSPGQAAILAVASGADAVIVGEIEKAWIIVDEIIEAVEAGILSRERLENAAAKILASKKTLGLIPDN